MRQHYPDYGPPMRVKDYIKFLEWQEQRDESKAKKKEENDKKKNDKPKPHSFTFAEGIIIAYVAQFVLGPLYNYYIATLGLH